MLPANFSVKGYAAVTFKDAKDNMSASTIWSTIMKIQKYYPKKIDLCFSSTRGGQDKTTNEDPLIASAIMNMVKGCVEACQIKESKGAAMSLLLGRCYEYKVPFGISSDDIGHKSIILTLPFPMSGCYTMSAKFDGSIKKDNKREHYMVDVSLDIYIGQLSDEQYLNSIDQGVVVYPFKLNHPEYYPRADSSESEPTTDQSEEDEPDKQKRVPRKRSKSPAYNTKKRGISKKRKSQGINRRLLDAFNAVARQGQGSTPDERPRPSETKTDTDEAGTNQ
ncbi:MAG: glycoprotein [Tomato betanucleorhabdovirus 1]|uniref:Glycoprotein n=1 Tax=Tomato betanucleorhabdovirus 1 TaxID=2950850 RepID=A0AAE9SK28_9RHAB|nr:MAG: glycoprotein [Tomato betanucleorhabdovirus 1]